MTGQFDFGRYKEEVESSIQDIITDKKCQPILFVGSGLSRRYFGAPGWHELLSAVCAAITDGGHPYEYYKMRGDSPIEIGSMIAERAYEWAWSDGRKHFPAELYGSSGSRDAFLKHLVSDILNAATPTVDTLHSSELWPEIKALLNIRPHAIITTNFDPFLERVFDGYETIVGQKVIKYDMNSFGEIFKIHGCSSDPQTLVMTRADYDTYTLRRRYLVAKLLTYFIEHPVFVFGYGFGDPNVASIIADVGEIIADDDGLIPNIFYVKWDPDAATKRSPFEHIITGGEKAYRVRAIVTDELEWIYKSLGLVDKA